ncbi:type I 3-dehydroquinate dehydratase [Eubacteriaceae bacterium ES2]|nr:type I 3-dehydroquinate dehydratase [Eubacteriaceae bacterium ES2]
MKEIRKDTYHACIPLTGISMAEVESEIVDGMRQQCDYFEWRRDYFGIGDKISKSRERENLLAIRQKIGETGLIYTFRGQAEGGAGDWSDADRLMGIKTAICSDVVDYIDVELVNSDAFHQEIIKALKTGQSGKILSSHNFDQTPGIKEIAGIFSKMTEKNADVLKLAVKTETLHDLQRLIKASLNFQTDRSMIVIGMGSAGALTRIAPEILGGSLSFAAGAKKTAPGQLGIEEIIKLRDALGL